jgi:hypothetical protein
VSVVEATAEYHDTLRYHNSMQIYNLSLNLIYIEMSTVDSMSWLQRAGP